MSAKPTIGFLGAGKISCLLVACVTLLAGCGTPKLHPRTPMKMDTLKALVGTNVVMQGGVLSSADPARHTQIIELKTTSGAFLASVSRTTHPTSEAAQYELASAADRSGGRLPKRKSKQGLEFISDPAETHYVFRHENVLVQVAFRNELPEPFSAPPAKQQLIDAILSASRERGTFEPGVDSEKSPKRHP